MIVSNISVKMDKSDTDSVTSVDTMKESTAGLTLTRAYSITSEPPPAYKKPTANSVRIARLIAGTVVAVAAILGLAIVLAAYIQSREAAHQHVTEKQQTQAVPVTQVDPPSALTSDDTPDSSSEEASSDLSEEQGQRRLDSEPDILEEFLENEGKILRLDNSDETDISDLAEMFLGQKQPPNTKCVFQRKPIGGGLDNALNMPFKSNATAIPILSRVAGESISVICHNTDVQADLSSADTPLQGLLQSNPFGIALNQVMGPIPILIRENGAMPINPFAAAQMYPSRLAELRQGFNIPPPPPPPPQIRPFVQRDRSFDGPFHPFGPLSHMSNQPFPPRMPFSQMPMSNAPLSFQQSPMSPQQSLEMIGDRRKFQERPRPFIFPLKNSILDQQMSPPPFANIPERSANHLVFDKPVISLPERRGRVPLFTIPDRRANPTPFNMAPAQQNRQSQQFQQQQPNSHPSPPIRPAQADQFFHVPKPSALSEGPAPVETEATPPVAIVRSRANAARRLQDFSVPTILPIRSGIPVQTSSVPIPLPFLQVPGRPTPVQVLDRSSPTPVDIPFLNVHDIDDEDEHDDEENMGHPSFFERLLGSLKISRSRVDKKSSPLLEEKNFSQSIPVPPSLRPELGVEVAAPQSRQTNSNGRSTGIVGGSASPIARGLRLPVIPPNAAPFVRPEAKIASDESIEVTIGSREDKNESGELIQPR